MEQILPRIGKPEDLRNLSLPELQTLSGEIREKILETTARNGGHLASNLGAVELTVALHRVFHAPEDRIVWDVGHQSYAHKLLTGRAELFHTLRQYGGLSGFTSRAESPFDCFGAGHAGTSISAAMGFAAADEIRHRARHTVAVTGDGSLICGISLEALNNLSSTCRNMILVLNDNKMSISKSIGAIPNYLNRIITGRSYNRFKAYAKMIVRGMPGGESIIGGIRNLEASAKNLFVPGIFFEELGIRYVGPINGHSLPDLIQTFERVRDFTRPVLVHVITEKGRGCAYAMASPEKYHGVGRFDPETGIPAAAAPRETFSSAFGKKLFRMAGEHPEIAAVSAAMATGCGIPREFAEQYPDRFFDTGIAEEHAVVFSAGLAAAGMRPVTGIYATFLQRAFDCVFHDVCLQNLPVILCADRAGVVEDGPTHHGIYDLAFLRSVPHLAILAPRSERMLEHMMDLAYEKALPTLIRYPRGSSGAPENEVCAPPVWGRAEVVREGSDLAIWTYGRDVYLMLETARILEEKSGLHAAVVDARFLRPFDAALLREQAARMPIVTEEDHVTRGGLASIAAETLAGMPCKGLFSFGWDADRIVPHGAVAELRRAQGLLPEQLAQSIASAAGGTGHASR